jgi:hypothetical protein
MTYELMLWKKGIECTPCGQYTTLGLLAIMSQNDEKDNVHARDLLEFSFCSGTSRIAQYLEGLVLRVRLNDEQQPEMVLSDTMRLQFR